MRSDTFARLIKAGINSAANCEGKAATAIEDELGQQIGVSVATIQRYKAGHIPPDPQTIQVLAELAVKRGRLNREWLQDFLRAAKYPDPDRLVASLYPDTAASSTQNVICQNIPPPTYSQFVMRPETYTEVAHGLRQRSAAVLIVSMGGMGKTSLALEVASNCLKVGTNLPRFDAAVWVSDKDRPGTVTLNTVLDEIARTLDYNGFTSLEYEEKQHKIEQLLRQQRVLLIIDNFETISDGTLLPWLLQLPEPSKVLITSREYSQTFRNNTFVIDLPGMNGEEAQLLILQRLKLLHLEKLVSEPSQLEPLIQITGGNPKSIEMALGCIKYERHPLQQVMDDLQAARGELFEELFSRCWSLLDETARRVLMAVPLFQNSVSNQALAITSDVSGFSFDRAVDRLVDLALLDVQQIDLNSTPRYTLHPLVRAFSVAKLRESDDFEQGARDRWVAWYIQLAAKVGYCWGDTSRLQILDPEQETIHSVVVWSLQNKRYDDVIQMARGIGYYYFVRGLWNKHPYINLVQAEAARYLCDTLEEIRGLAYFIQIVSRQGHVSETEQLLQRLRELTEATELPADAFFNVQHAIALHALTQRDFDVAQQAWEKSLALAGKLSTHIYVINRQWLATCLYQKGDLTTAQQLFREALRDAVRHGIPRCVLFCKVKLASIDLDLGLLDSAKEVLSEVYAQAHHYQDREHLAEIQRTYARFYIHTGDLQAARTALEESIELFERLGLRQEQAKTGDELEALANYTS